MSKQPSHERDQQILDLLDGNLSDKEQAELRAWLDQSPEHYDRFVELSFIHSQLVSQLQGQRSAEVVRLGSLQVITQPGCLAELARLEDQAEPMTVTIHDTSDWKGPGPSNQAWHDAAAYLLRHTFTPKRLAIGGIAAALLLGAVLAIVLMGGPEPQPQIVERLSQPEVSVSTLTVVAALTAEHDALWDRRPGQDIYAGQRFTLTEGFAELTTAKGAVALLEAPCTVTFDTSGNSLLLEAGRLVAEVPEQAAGFTVDTPTAQVIDYGTRFGVEVETDGATHAAVFAGEVELSEIGPTPDQPTRNVRLTQGWASRVTRNGELDREPRPVRAADLGRFVMSMDEATDQGFAYRRAVLSSRPVVYWGFDQGRTSTQNLAGDKTFDGQSIGQVGHARGLFGSAIQLTGDIDSIGTVVCDNPLPFETVRAYTLEAWCYLASPHHGRVITLGRDDDKYFQKSVGMIEVLGGEDLPSSLRPHADSIRFLHDATDPEQAITSQNLFAPTTLATGQWMHVVAVRDDTKATLYINGQVAAVTKDALSALSEPALGLYIGVANLRTDAPDKKPHEFRGFHGLIDEVAVYDHALTPQTIQSHYQLGRPDDGGQSLP